MGALFNEKDLFRIDHYLGKEMVQNLMVLRFANSWLEPNWNRDKISSVLITFKEDIGTMGRGGYFDEFGIIRDVMQNHLLQVLSIIAMEAPLSVHGGEGNHVRDEKVKALRCIAPIAVEDCVLGQYVADEKGDNPGYLEDETVPKGSRCPTFATCVLKVNNSRWEGVPFIIKCGKALDERKTEVRIQFRQQPGASHMFPGETIPPNELVIRLQPNEAIYLKTNIKSPGLQTIPTQVEMDLSYTTRFPGAHNPDAYTRLILDVLRGKQAGFVRDDELEAAWAIFTPLLHKIDAGHIQPVPYKFGSRGPEESDALLASNGFFRNENYSWQQQSNL
jgi:glucose-6-phosphate 1-dehydrogenase